MYPRAFHYHRARTLQEAAGMLAEFGDGAKLLAGGQSLIPLMKLRFANPNHLVDVNFIPDTSYIKEANGSLRFGALTRLHLCGESLTMFPIGTSKVSMNSGIVP